MKSIHSITVAPQIAVRDGMVTFLAKSTNLARLGMSAGEGAITVTEFIRRFSPRVAGELVVLRNKGNFWTLAKDQSGEPNYQVESIELRRLNDFTPEERAADCGNRNHDREDNPFMFLIRLSKL